MSNAIEKIARSAARSAQGSNEVSSRRGFLRKSLRLIGASTVAVAASVGLLEKDSQAHYIYPACGAGGACQWAITHQHCLSAGGGAGCTWFNVYEYFCQNGCRIDGYYSNTYIRCTGPAGC